MEVIKMGKARNIIISIAMTLLLVFTIACTPAQKEITPATEKTTKEEVTAPEDGDSESILEPTSTVKWGIIEMRVTDPPAAEVKSAIVYLTNVEVHMAVAEQEIEQEQEQSFGDNQTPQQEQEQEGGSKWISIIGAPPSFDLLGVIGVEALLGTTNVTAGKYTQVRMDVDRVEVVTVDGDNITAEVPGDKLKIIRPFDVEAGMTTILTLDFDGSKSLIITGKDKAIFKPVVKLLVEKGGEVSKMAKAGKDEVEGDEEESGKGETGNAGQPGKAGDKGNSGKAGKVDDEDEDEGEDDDEEEQGDETETNN